MIRFTDLVFRNSLGTGIIGFHLYTGITGRFFEAELILQ